MTEYQAVYDRFLRKVEDLELARMNPDDQQMMLFGWLDSALSLIQAECIQMQSDLTKRDDLIRRFEADLKPNELEAIALYMVGCWYEDRINSIEHTNMFLGTTDEKWNNQKDHLSGLYEIQNSYFTRARKMFRNYNYKVGMVQNEVT